MSVELVDRANRYSKLIGVKDLQNTHAVVVGVGSVGRPLALQLAVMGVGALTVYDPDEVSRTNLGSQGYPELHFDDSDEEGGLYESVGVSKVSVLQAEIALLNPDLDRTGYLGLGTKFPETEKEMDEEYDLLFGEGGAAPSVFFICVDTMAARWDIVKLITKQYPDAIIIDCRVAAETGRVVIVPPILPGASATESTAASRQQFYRDRWFPDEQGLDEVCGYRATSFSSTLAACFAISRWTVLLRLQKDNNTFSLDDCDMVFDLTSALLMPNPRPVQQKETPVAVDLTTPTVAPLPGAGGC